MSVSLGAGAEQGRGGRALRQGGDAGPLPFCAEGLCPLRAYLHGTLWALLRACVLSVPLCLGRMN